MTGEVEPNIIVDAAFANDALLERLRADPKAVRFLSPRRFEEIIARMFEREGYRVELTPMSHDGGFDLVVVQCRDFGTFVHLVECKRYIPPNKVGVRDVRALYGVVQRCNVNAGILVTTSYFTLPARRFAAALKYTLQLQDFAALEDWLFAWRP